MCAAADRRRSAHALPIRPDSPSGPSRHTRIDMHMLCRSQCAYRHATEAHAPANTTSARAAWNTLAQLHQPCRCVARFEFIAAVAKPSRRGAPSSTAAAPKGSMFSFIICSCHRPRRGAPGCSRVVGSCLRTGTRRPATLDLRGHPCSRCRPSVWPPEKGPFLIEKFVSP
jgi:hypothetical protein